MPRKIWLVKSEEFKGCYYYFNDLYVLIEFGKDINLIFYFQVRFSLEDFLQNKVIKM